MKAITPHETSLKTALRYWITFFFVCMLGIFSWSSARAITIDFDSGYTANSLLEGLPTTGTHWTRSANSGNANSALKIIAGDGIDGNQAATSQGSDGTVESSSYYFNPSSTDLGGTFNSSSSVINYSFSMCLDSNPNTSTGDVLRVFLCNSVAAEITLCGNGHVTAYDDRTQIVLKTTKAGSTDFVALGGVYFTVSGQLNFATKTFTIFLNGVAQEGSTGETNFAFYASPTSPEISIANVYPEDSTWLPASISHIEYWLDPTWSAPITISSGGTYTGNWASTSATTPAVTITTSAPVTIQNSNVKGPYQLIYTSNVGANLTVTNSKGYGQNPNVSGQVMPRFIYAYNVKSLTATNNYMEATAGIIMTGNYTGSQTATIENNYAFNIDGRLSDGVGGYSGTPTLSQLVQFIQLNNVLAMSSGTISWNKIVNVPNECRPEDSISVFESGGTSGNPLLIYDNYVQGGYPTVLGGTYTGTGITCGDGSANTPTTCAAYVSAYNNVVLNYANAGMAIYAGHDISMTNNHLYSCGYVGVNTPASNPNATGHILWNLYNETAGTVFFNNTATGNDIGWYSANYAVPSGDPTTRDYYYSPAYPAGVTGNTWHTGTQAEEQAESAWWYSQVSLNGINIGPNW